jgi:hypothetical protein
LLREPRVSADITNRAQLRLVKCNWTFHERPMPPKEKSNPELDGVGRDSVPMNPARSACSAFSALSTGPAPIIAQLGHAVYDERDRRIPELANRFESAGCSELDVLGRAARSSIGYKGFDKSSYDETQAASDR